jgi:hypothetical protein
MVSEVLVHHGREGLAHVMQIRKLKEKRGEERGNEREKKREREREKECFYFFHVLSTVMVLPLDRMGLPPHS